MIFILVDGEDDLGVLPARQMLDSVRDANGKVKLPGADLASLANLAVVEQTGIHRSARGADRGSKHVGQRTMSSVKRLHGNIGLDQHPAIGAHDQSGTDGLLRLRYADRHVHDFVWLCPFLSAG